jgi:hypothetical protein
MRPEEKTLLVQVLLRESKCPVCGKPKALKQCLCKTCYFALPPAKRNGLYVSALNGDEFYDNFQAAIVTLRKKGLGQKVKA